MSRMRVNKIEAARRQTDAAIRLFFREEDPIAVHTLAAAGGRILRDLCDKQPNAKNYHALITALSPDLTDVFWTGMNKAANFFKHADKDPEEILENTNEEINEGMIGFNCQFYSDLGYEFTREMKFFMGWFFISHPETVRLLNTGAYTDNHRASYQKNFRDFHLKTRSERLVIGCDLFKDFIN